jgi:hypothetical protein
VSSAQPQLLGGLKRDTLNENRASTYAFFRVPLAEQGKLQSEATHDVLLQIAHNLLQVVYSNGNKRTSNK